MILWFWSPDPASEKQPETIKRGAEEVANGAMVLKPKDIGPWLPSAQRAMGEEAAIIPADMRTETE